LPTPVAAPTISNYRGFDDPAANGAIMRGADAANPLRLEAKRSA